MITKRELREEIYKVTEDLEKKAKIKELNYKLDRFIINNKLVPNISYLTSEKNQYVKYSVFKKHDGFYYTRVSYEKEYPFCIITEKMYYNYNVPKKHQQKFNKLQTLLELI